MTAICRYVKLTTVIIMNFLNLKNCMDRMIEYYKTPGVDCIVYKNHEILYRYTAGMNDIVENTKLLGDELYIIYSMTKMITCTAALQLLEKGKYELSDRLSDYMPEFSKMKITADELNTSNAANITTGKTSGESVRNSSDGYAQNPITIKDLFTMGAGLDYAIRDEGINKAISQGKKNTRDLVGAMSEKVLGFEPGTRFRYSLCHDVLGALIEIWSGKKFGDYLKENIFEPLGMKNTFFGIPKDEERLSKMAALYFRDMNGNAKKTRLMCSYNITDEYESGGAGLISSTEDYALFLDALACGGMGKTGNRILGEETVKLMKTNQLSGMQSKDFFEIRPGYGYGLGVRTHIDKEMSGSNSPLGEFGWDGAAGAFAMVDTDNKISLTYFQHVHGWDTAIQNEIRNALYQDISNS